MIVAVVQMCATLEKAELDAREAAAPLPHTCDSFHIRFWLLLLLSGGLLWPISSRAASFNCSNAKRPLEVLICNDAKLSSLDRQEGDVYYELRATVPKGSTEAAGLLNEQREFLSNRTRTCSIPDIIPDNPVLYAADSNRAITCLKELYTLRVNELRKRLATSGRQNGPPSDLLAAVRDDLISEDIFDRDDPCLEHLADNIDTTPIEVNQSGPAWLVEGVEGYNCLAGNDNHSIFAYIRSGNGWRKILDGNGQDLEIGRTSTHGLSDLVLYEHASAYEHYETVYQFDGKEYKETGCNDVLAPGCSPCSTPGSRCVNGIQCRTPVTGDTPYKRPCALNHE